MRVAFTKMHGCGNDYVFVDGFVHALPAERWARLARPWSDRHFGIGGDGLIVMAPSRTAAVAMWMWNADGSRGAMCGNGLRCLARFAHDHGRVDGGTFDVETDAGLRRVELLDEPSACVRTWMGDVRIEAPRTLEVGGERVELTPGDAGNPHAVVFVDDVETAPVHHLGPLLQRHPAFPDGVNVEFVQRLADDRLRQRTFERGSGETLACGTGAAVAATALRARVARPAERTFVELRGGTLIVLTRGPALAIEGPASTVYRGDVEIAE
jgi:diaminopimelate epimerase